MSDFLARISHFSPKRLALLADELNERVQQLERSRHEPVAIVGIGCRLPGGVDTPQAYWQLLRERIDAVTEVPAGRFAVDDWYDPDPDRAGRMATRWGGFIGPVDGFDAPFFGISPREAQSMDPQQRLLLEVAWRALEHAGIAPDSLEGSRGGVYLGMSAGDYWQMLRDQGPDSFDAYTASGIAHSIASGRLSYLLGLRGPSLSIDTACSSSLVAVHHAVHSLRRGECDLALAGGVNLILTPDITVALSRSHMMAPDGRCKAFDARADGFVRSEGCVVLVLKRLADAQAAGDRIVAVIRGSAANQDGRSNGLTAPNGPAQEQVLREALADAGVAPASVGFVEAHGTGTALGDPIEVQALARVYGEGRAAGDALRIGSAKASIGHAEACAGAAGLLKLALALQHAEVPGQLHLNEPNPYIPWADLPVRVPVSTEAWPAAEGVPRRGGVSSFGFSGTNVHLVLEEAPPARSGGDAAARPVELLTISARSEAALADLARRWRDHLARSGQSWPDSAHVANAGRARFAHRIALLASSAAEASLRLDQHLAGDAVEGLVSGVAPARAPRVAFLFTGQGAQYTGMARGLYDSEPVFRAELDRCAALLDATLPRPLLDVLYPRDGADSAIDDTAFTQPALFAVEYALARLWMSWGVQPQALVGHSVGELVAACIAGVFSLEEGLALVAERGRLMGALPAGGGMAAVMADGARVGAALAPWAGQLTIAALNGPQHTVVSGDQAALEAFLDVAAREGWPVSRLKVSHAFHSPRMDPMLEAFEAAAARVAMSPPRIDLYDNLSGRRADARMAGAAYWRDQVRAPVRFADALQAAVAAGCDLFIEMGPHPVLLGLAAACLPEGRVRCLPSLRRGRGDGLTLLGSVAEAHVAGVAIDWRAFDAGRSRSRVDVPRYPFQRERFWVDAAAARPSAARAPAVAPDDLLGAEWMHSLGPQRVFDSLWHAGQPGWLADHRILGQVRMPSPVYMAMAVAAAARVLGDGPCRIDGFELLQALVLDGEQPRRLQSVAEPSADGLAWRVQALDDDGRSWLPMARARLSRSDMLAPAGMPPPLLAARCTEPVEVDGYYDWLQGLGLQFGPFFRAIASLQRGPGEALARLRRPDGLAPLPRLPWHPAMLDAALHAVGAALPQAGQEVDEAFLLVHVEHIAVHAPLGDEAWAHVRVDPGAWTPGARPETFQASLNLIDAHGSLLAALEGLHFKRARRGDVADQAPAPAVRAMLHEIAWKEVPLVGDGLSPAELVAAAEPEREALAQRLGFDAYARFLPGLDTLASAYVRRALAELGAPLVAGAWLDPGGLRERLGVLPRHERLLARMLAMLSEDGWLVRDGNGWRVTRDDDGADPESQADALADAHPEGSAELVLTRRCARELAAVLRGRSDPLALLFPGGSLADTERLYRDSPPAQAYNALIGRLAAAVAGGHGRQRTLRVLEIGAGTGSTTAYVLPALAGQALEYTFTDVSPLFLNRARERFAGQAGMRYAVLDIGNDPLAQGLPAGGFDLVIGANVLHATPDLARTLAHVRQLLAPSGRLVLLEGTTPQRFGDLTVGLLEGWWAYVDDRDYALMPRERWLGLFARSGFASAAALPGENDHPVWSQQAVFVAQVPAEPAAARRWLIWPDAGGHGLSLAAGLRALGDSVVLPDPAEPPAAVLARENDPARPLHGVISFAALDAALHDDADSGELMASQSRLIGGTLALVQSLAAQRGTPPRLWLVTRGAQATAAGDAADPGQATLWGLSHVVAIEHPELGCRRIDIDPAWPASRSAEVLQRELRHPDIEDQVAWRANRRLARRLAAAGARGGAEPAVIAGDRRHLVTGGLHGLGLRMARWLADQGARHLVLVGRRPPDLAARSEIDRLLERGISVEVVALDVSRETEVQALMQRLRADGPPLAGIVHAAGALDDGVITALDWPRFASVMAAKVSGSWSLHRHAGALDYLVLFSSGASVAGSAGQANHAAANAFEDALAWYRQASGLPTLSVNWGPWAEIGAAADRRLAQPGFLQPMAPDDGLAALAHLMRRDTAGLPFPRAQVAVLRTDWAHLRPAREAGTCPPLFESLGTASNLKAAAPTTAPAAAAPTRERGLRAQLEASAPNRRRHLLREQVRALAAKVLGLARPEDLEVAEPLRQLGLDSLMAVELRNLLGRAAGQTLPATVTFDHPSVEALSAFLAGEVLSDLFVPAPPAAAAVPTAAPSATDGLDADDIALQLMNRLDQLGQGDAS